MLVPISLGGCMQMQKQTKQCFDACHTIPPSLLLESSRGGGHRLKFSAVDDLVRQPPPKRTRGEEP